MKYLFSSLAVSLLALTMSIETIFACSDFSGTFKIQFEDPSEDGEITIKTDSKGGWTVFRITEHYQRSPLHKSSFSVRLGNPEEGEPYCKDNKVFLKHLDSDKVLSFGLSENGDLEIYQNKELIQTAAKIADRTETEAENDPTPFYPLRKFRRTLPCAESNSRTNPATEMQTHWNNDLQPVFNFGAPSIQEPLPKDFEQPLLSFSPLNILGLHLHQDQYSATMEQDLDLPAAGHSQDPNPSDNLEHPILDDFIKPHNRKPKTVRTGISTPRKPKQLRRPGTVLDPSKPRNFRGKAIGTYKNLVTLTDEDRKNLVPDNGFHRVLGKQLYHCGWNDCPYNSTNRPNMIKHFNGHTGKDFHYCPFCRAQLIQQRGFRRHIPNCESPNAPKTQEALATFLKEAKKDYRRFKIPPSQSGVGNQVPDQGQ